jgi:Tol biopolymer transport system component
MQSISLRGARIRAFFVAAVFVVAVSIWTTRQRAGMFPTIGAAIQLSAQSFNGKIAFKSGSGISTINPDGSGRTQITQDGNNFTPSWSRDGSKIAFSRQGPQDTRRFIYMMNPDGTNLNKINTAPSSDVDPFDPTWSPDGSKIAFQTYVGSNAEIFVMNVDGSNRINLTNNSEIDAAPRWSPDGTKIAFVSSRDFPGISGDVTRGFEIYVMNADGSNPTRLTNNTFSDSNPSWSVDSSKLAFDSNRDGNFEVYVMNADGTAQVDLSNNSSSDYGPCWSPDGQKIAFLSYRDSVFNSPQDIFVMNADGSGQTHVTNGFLDPNQLSWQPISNALPTPTPSPTPSPSPSPSPLVVVSQVYGGGGTAGAAYRNSFVELFNRGATTVDLNQWTVRFASATDVFIVQLMWVGNTPIRPGQYMLIQLGSEGSNGNPLPSPDFTSPFILGTSGKIALAKPNAVVSTVTCPLPNSQIADFVGFGSTANCFEGGGPGPTLNNKSAALRNAGGCTDNNDNVSDFSIGSPNPHNSNSPIHNCNLIDDVRFFVRQHYLDFLNREPDQSGWDFWTNQIVSCGGNSQCTEVRRIDVSASFFLSIEFQQTGYLVERFYKVAYGDQLGTSTFGLNHQLAVPAVRFSDFLQGTQRIGQGVIVLQPGWEQLLENNKQAYALEFVQTARFTAANAFPTTMTPAEFVDKLDQNAGNVLSQSERTIAINLFGGTTDSSDTTARARAVRQVAEDQDLYTAEFNRAFVLAQYFGYLRRNPNDPQDTDYTGYDFWLTKLNQFNGNYINAEMVKAFLSSIEYRQRFGQ